MLQKSILFVVTFIIASIFIYLCTYDLNSDVALNILGIEATEDALKQWENEHLQQYGLIEFFIWLKQMFTMHWGTSYVSEQPVSEVITQALHVTFFITIFTMLFFTIIFVPTAMFIGIYRNNKLNKYSDIVITILLSIPVFFLAYIVNLIVFNTHIFDLPYDLYNQGHVISALILPSITLAIAVGVWFLKIFIPVVRKTMRSSYITYLTAMGMHTNKRILLKHVLVSVYPVLSGLFGTLCAYIITGSIVIENFFNVPGMGQITIEAVNNQDIPVLQAVLLLFVFMVSLITITFNSKKQ